MEYRILGPVEVHDDRGNEIPLDGAKQRTLLAALVIANGSLLPDRALSAALWGSRPPATLRAQIYNQVSRLRKAFGDRADVVRRSSGYLLRTDTAQVDLADFENLATRGNAAQVAGRFDEAGRLLRAALRLWRGPALANVSEFLSGDEGPRLEEARLNVLENRVEADLAAGRHAAVLPELTSLVNHYPLRERFCAQLMTTLYRCDRTAEALSLYDRSRQLLVREFGIEPSALLRRVHRAVLTGDPGLHRPLDGRLVG